MSKNLILLTAGRAISGFGTGVFSFALSLYILDITHSALLFSLVIGFTFIPAVVMNFMGGIWVDRLNKKNIIIYTDLLSGLLIVLYLPFWYYFPTSIPVIVLYTCLLSFVQALNNLAVQSIIPEIMDESQVPRANAFIQITNTLINLIGPVAGAILYHVSGMFSILVFDSISFLFAGIIELFIVVKWVAKPLLKSVSLGKEYKEGLVFLFQKPMLRFLLLLTIIINGLYMPLMLIVIPFINYQVIQISGTQLSIIEAAWALGAIIGGAYIASQKRTNRFIPRLFIWLGLQALMIAIWIVPGLNYFSLSLNQITLFFSLSLITIGILNMVQNIPLFSYVQLSIPDEIRGKILGLINVFMMLSTPIGMFIYGSLLQKDNWMLVTGVTSAIIFICAILAHFSPIFIQFKKELITIDLKPLNINAHE
jgi:DHA3 family macrolide efflux protein-like MFS transporter